jgi:hypothetical protein
MTLFITRTEKGSEHTWCWRDEDDGGADLFCYLPSLLRFANVFLCCFFPVHSPLSLSLSLFFFLFPSALLCSPLSAFFSCCFFSFLRSPSVCFLFLTFPSPSVFSFLYLIVFFFYLLFIVFLWLL